MAPPDVLPVIYYFPSSFYTQKVLWALAEKGVPFKKRLVMLPDLEIYAPWYMKLNPMGQVPMLQHGNKYISDSKAITEYIDENFDGPRLFPSQRVRELVTLLDSLIIPILTYGASMTPDLIKDCQLPAVYLKHMRDTMKSNKMLKVLQKYKDQCTNDVELQKAYQTKLEHHYLGGAVEDVRPKLIKAQEEADKVFAEIEKQLLEVSKGGKVAWLTGEAFTAADIALGVALQRLHWIGHSHRLWSTRPIVEEYRQKLLTEKPDYVRICVELEGMKGIMMWRSIKGLVQKLPYLVGLSAIGIGVFYYLKPKMMK